MARRDLDPPVPATASARPAALGVGVGGGLLLVHAGAGLLLWVCVAFLPVWVVAAAALGLGAWSACWVTQRQRRGGPLSPRRHLTWTLPALAAGVVLPAAALAALGTRVQTVAVVLPPVLFVAGALVAHAARSGGRARA